jgi:hypothetical protein
MRLRKAPRAPLALQRSREQLESAFAGILSMLLARVRGARAAALVDADGETVDYVGGADPYAVRVAAAHWRIVLEGAQAVLGESLSIGVRLARASYVVHALPNGYAIVLLLRQHAQLGGHRRPMSACARLLAEEAGWAVAPQFQWSAVDVVSNDVGKPQGLRVGGRIESIDILGRYEAGLGWRERAWRVRLASGVEAMLVRERSGFWYTDEVVAARAPKKGPPPPRSRTETKKLSAWARGAAARSLGRCSCRKPPSRAHDPGDEPARAHDPGDKPGQDPGDKPGQDPGDKRG